MVYATYFMRAILQPPQQERSGSSAAAASKELRLHRRTEIKGLWSPGAQHWPRRAFRGT